MSDEKITYQSLSGLAQVAGFCYGIGGDTREQAGHVIASIVSDARAAHFPVAPLILIFADSYAQGLRQIESAQT